MLSILSKTVEKINWKHWLFFFLLSQSIYVLMLSQTIPRISREAGGMKIFDMLPLGYSYHYANSFLSQLTEHGYSLYKYVQLPLDIFFPIFNFGAGFCMFVLLLRTYCSMRRKSMKGFYFLLQWISLSLLFSAMLFDYLENILIVTMLYFKENVPINIVLAAKTFTMIKSISTTTFYCISLLIIIAIGVSWFQYKRKEKKTVGKLQFTREEKSTVEDGDPRGNATIAKNERTY